MHRTLVIRREYLHFIPKYSRYEKRHKNLSAHVSPAFRVTEGDQVTVGQCRPLSKTVCSSFFTLVVLFLWIKAGLLSHCLGDRERTIEKTKLIDILRLTGPIQRSPRPAQDRKSSKGISEVLRIGERLLALIIWGGNGWKDENEKRGRRRRKEKEGEGGLAN